jgi:hypothetical protein
MLGLGMMKIDWNYFLFWQVMGLAITMVFYVFDPKHQWEPRVLAMSMQMVSGLILSLRTTKE